MNKITLSISLNEAKILYKEVTLERKLELEELFPELKPQLITDKVKTYEDALKALGREDFSHENLYPREIAKRKLEIIVEALNEGWKPDFNDIKQNQWYCWYYRSNAGLRYSIANYSPAYTNVTFGVRLCLKDKKVADYIGEQFKYLYEEMLLG